MATTELARRQNLLFRGLVGQGLVLAVEMVIGKGTHQDWREKMTAIRRDHSHPDRSSTQQAPRRWDLASVVDLDQASEAADTVLSALKEACYNERDIEGMRIALDEAIANAILSGRWQHPQTSQLAIRSRINECVANVEVELQRANLRLQSITSLDGCVKNRKAAQKSSPSLRPYMTWIRYSRRDHSATMCQCSLLE